MCVLEGVNVRSIAGSGCESFGRVHFTGFVDGPWGPAHGIYPWDSALVMGKFDGVGVLCGSQCL
jgi:hypothetical protein